MTLISTIFGTSIIDFMVRFILLLVGVVLGIVVTAFMTPPAQMLRISEKDGRGWELKIKDETPKFLETKSKPPLRYLKWGRSYEFVLGWMKKKVTRFLGKEGTAYSWQLFGFDKVPVECPEEEAEDHIEEKIPILNPDTGNIVLLEGEPAFELKLNPVRYETKKIDYMFETLADAVEYKLGSKFYNTIPQKRRDELLDNKVYMTVELETGLTPKGYTPISEQDINEEGDKNFIKLLSQDLKGALQVPVLQYFFIMGFGGFLTMIGLILFGYMPVGT